MVSSGIRIGAWEYLRWKHIRPLDKNGQPLDRDLSVREDGQIAAAKITVYGGEELLQRKMLIILWQRL
jgi:hypothetical protein